MTSDYERRVRHLETELGKALRRLERVEQRNAALEQERGRGGGGGGGGSYSDLLVALTPVDGIPRAVYTPASGGDPWRLVPGSAQCKIGRRDGDDFIDSGQTDTLWNDYTSSMSSDIAGNTMVPFGLDAVGRKRVLGEPC